MIDYEVKIFNKVHGKTAALCAKNRVVSVPILDYTKLPALSLYEMNNTTVKEAQSSTPTENRARITYQLDVIAETKAKCREIFAVADTEMVALNFRRISGQFITYPDNTKVVRYVARYEAEVDPDGNLYRTP